MDLFPFLKEFGEISPQLVGLRDECEKVHVEPGLVERRFADKHAACVDKIAYGCPTRINQTLINDDSEFF